MAERRRCAVALAFVVVVACGRRDVVVLESKGSDTMVNLLVRLSERYAAVETTAVVAVSGGGSGTGLAGLIDGTTDMAAASREIQPREEAAAADRGVAPYATVIARDGLAIYVHRDNPVARLSLADLRCVYAEGGGCERWSDLGVAVTCPGGDDSIIRLGRHNNSGTYEYFRETVLGPGGRFAATIDQSGTQQVVDVASTVPCAIGYGGMGYEGPGVRLACVAADSDDPCVEPTLANVSRGAYPFSRPLYLYTDGRPRGHVAAFIDWVLSDAGQAIVLKGGFVPVAGAEGAHG